MSTEAKLPPAGTDVCASADVLDGKARVVSFDAWPGLEVIVVREGDAVHGYINECKHMAVPLNLLDDYGVETAQHLLLCDHHHAAFRFSDGHCVAGPCAGESLTAVPLATRHGRVIIGESPPHP